MVFDEVEIQVTTGTGWWTDSPKTVAMVNEQRANPEKGNTAEGMKWQYKKAAPARWNRWNQVDRRMVK